MQGRLLALEYDPNTLLHIDILSYLFPSNYRPQRSWGKVIFSQASVILFTGEGGLPQCMLGYHPPDQTPPPHQAHPHGAEHTGRYGQRAGGMHRTGMQSCLVLH